MPESLTAVGAYFAASGAADATVMTAAAASDVGAGAVAAGVGTAGMSGAAGLAGTAAAAGGTSMLASAGTAAAAAAATAGVTSLLAPKPPKIPGATPMPDAQAQDVARKQSIAEQMARRGRASTVLTDSSAGTLGG